MGVGCGGREERGIRDSSHPTHCSNESGLDLQLVPVIKSGCFGVKEIRGQSGPDLEAREWFLFAATTVLRLQKECS